MTTPLAPSLLPLAQKRGSIVGVYWGEYLTRRQFVARHGWRHGVPIVPTEAERAEEYLQQREAKEAAAERSRRTAERRAQADEQKQKETPPPFVI